MAHPAPTIAASAASGRPRAFFEGAPRPPGLADETTVQDNESEDAPRLDDGRPVRAEFMPFLIATQARLLLSLRQLAVLGLVEALPGMSTGAYAELARLSKPVTTRAIDVLQKHGLVTRKPDNLDRRKVTVTLSEKGRKKIRQISAARLLPARKMANA